MTILTDNTLIGVWTGQPLIIRFVNWRTPEAELMAGGTELALLGKWLLGIHGIFAAGCLVNLMVTLAAYLWNRNVYRFGGRLPASRADSPEFS